MLRETMRAEGERVSAGGGGDRQTDRQTDRQAGRQADRQSPCVRACLCVCVRACLYMWLGGRRGASETNE